MNLSETLQKVRRFNCNDTKASSNDFIRESMDIFENQIPVELPHESANELVDLILEIAAIASKLDCGYDIVLEGWKCFIKLLKTNSINISRESCNLVADVLCKNVSNGILALLRDGANEKRLALLCFYHQRISATLAYCLKALDDCKIFDLHYQLAAARGLLLLPCVIGYEVDAMKEKMDSNFMKTMFHPDTKDSSLHKLKFIDSISSRGLSSWAMLSNLDICRTMGVFSFQLVSLRHLEDCSVDSLCGILPSLCGLIERVLATDLDNSKDVLIIRLCSDLAITLTDGLNRANIVEKNRLMVVLLVIYLSISFKMDFLHLYRRRF